MATENNADAPITRNDFSEIGKAIAAGIESARPKKVSFAEYLRREAKKNPRPKLKWDLATQNGIDMQFIGPNAPKVIALLNRITHGGRYFDRKLEVVVRTEGNTTGLELRYPWRTIDERLDMRNYWRNLVDMLEQIVEIQEQEDLEQATAPKRGSR